MTEYKYEYGWSIPYSCIRLEVLKEILKKAKKEKDVAYARRFRNRRK